jgi:hypothetical protein
MGAIMRIIPLSFRSFYLPKGAISAKPVKVEAEVELDESGNNHLVLYVEAFTNVKVTAFDSCLNWKFINPGTIDAYQIDEWKEEALGLVEENLADYYRSYRDA